MDLRIIKGEFLDPKLELIAFEKSEQGPKFGYQKKAVKEVKIVEKKETDFKSRMEELKKFKAINKAKM